MIWLSKSVLIAYCIIVAMATSSSAYAAVQTTVAVAGATGRTGSKVVSQLLEKGINVVALVRDVNKANVMFSSLSNKDNLTIYPCDLGSDQAVAKALKGCDAAIWCATGFSDSPGASFLEKLKKIFGLALAPKQSIDIVGIQAVSKSLMDSANARDSNASPKVVMLSSAGVTRTKWNEEKKAYFNGSADIPIGKSMSYSHV
jgi:NADP-dependent 3-hydroxy acid dehydrogenase YdfG